MKSIQVKNIDANRQMNYSDLQVMKSSADWYVGTVYNSTYGPEPGSRDTDYYDTKAEANLALALLEFYAERYSEEQVIAAFDSIVIQLGIDKRRVGYRIYPINLTLSGAP